MKKIFFICFLILGSTNFLIGQELWSLQPNNNQLRSKKDLFLRQEMPKDYKIYNIEGSQFEQKIKELQNNNLKEISIPTSNGLKQFFLEESSNFSNQLSRKFTNIKAFSGFQKDNKAIKVKVSKGLDGYHFAVYEPGKQTYLIDSYTKDSKSFIAYSRNELPAKNIDFSCEVEEFKSKENSFESENADDGVLRTYRIAVATTVEYAQFQLNRLNIPSTATDNIKKEAVLSAVNTTLNRVNGVFERDLSVKFQLISNNDQIVFLTGEDNLTNNDARSLINETQTLIDNVIGDSNYDIGHAFSTGAGGLAGLGVVCATGQKGNGVTGTSSPFGDRYDIDFVAHEIGHQMGANHTFNNSCDGNRSSSTAVEPGSGSTIMAYAGICSPNVQPSSDDHFHSVSIAEMWDIVQTSGGCATITSTGNSAPTANAGLDYSIPKSTPFILKGQGTDAEGVTSLTYNWEQIDAETNVAMPPQTTNSVGPMFQSLPSTFSPNRFLPNLAAVLAGNTVTWEVLPSVERELNFSLTVRDNNVIGGSSARDDMVVFVTNADPFIVTSQNTAVTWDTGSSQTITWNVGSTNLAPINCQKVNIKLSLNGGETFPINLASNIDNSGSYTFIVPDNASSEVRILIEAADNIFYNVNDSDIIINSTTPTVIIENSSGLGEVCNSENSSFTYNLSVDFVNGFSEDVTFSASGMPTGSNVDFSPNTLNTDGSVTMEVSNLSSAVPQLYTITIAATSSSITQELPVSLKVFSSDDFEPLQLTSPVDEAQDVLLTPILVWQNNTNASSYEIQVANDENFTNIVATGSSKNTSFQLETTLDQTSTYFWRVKPKNDCGEGTYSSVFSFSTEVCKVCNSVGNTQFNTSTTLVRFNTIDNNTFVVYDEDTGKENGYSDFTSISTTVEKGFSYDLTVNANTDGAFTTQTILWIDWNQNCRFDDAGEEYNLGTAFDQDNGSTSLSPLKIEVPSNAVIGNTIMRVATKYLDDGLPTACEMGADAEVEDYTLIVEGNPAALSDEVFISFNLYPNPSKGKVTLQFDTVNSDMVLIQLFDVSGRQVAEKTFNNVSSRFSEELLFENTASGLYLLKISNGNIQTTKKLVIR